MYHSILEAVEFLDHNLVEHLEVGSDQFGTVESERPENGVAFNIYTGPQ